MHSWTMLAGRNDETKSTPLSTDGSTLVCHTPKNNNWHKMTDLLRQLRYISAMGMIEFNSSFGFETVYPDYNEFLFANDYQS